MEYLSFVAETSNFII